MTPHPRTCGCSFWHHKCLISAPQRAGITASSTVYCLLSYQPQQNLPIGLRNSRSSTNSIAQQHPNSIQLLHLCFTLQLQVPVRFAARAAGAARCPGAPIVPAAVHAEVAAGLRFILRTSVEQLFEGLGLLGSSIYFLHLPFLALKHDLLGLSYFNIFLGDFLHLTNSHCPVISSPTGAPQAAPPFDGGVFMLLCLVMFPASPQWKRVQPSEKHTAILQSNFSAVKSALFRQIRS